MHAKSKDELLKNSIGAPVMRLNGLLIETATPIPQYL